MRPPCWIGLIALTGMIPAARMPGDSITLRPGADTSLFANFPDNNLGSNSNLVSGANGSGLAGRALIRFDVTTRIPSNAVIQSAALTVKVVIVPGGGGVDSVFDLRRVLVNWGEGIGIGNSGSPANDGEATWNNRVYPATLWTAPGGAAPNDFSETASASLLVAGPANYSFDSTSNLVADVQQWLLNPASNFGWVLISESESTPFTARRFGSREDTNATPLLDVLYVLPPAMEIQWVKSIGDQVQFGFLASAGQPYTVQHRDSLNSGSWLSLTNIDPQKTTTNLIVSDLLATNAQRFYRIGAY